jgi:hypothetical protein
MHTPSPIDPADIRLPEQKRGCRITKEETELNANAP